VTAGQAHENSSLIDLLQSVDDVLCDGDGQPIAWPLALAGDKGYRANWIDEMLVEMEIIPVIPSKGNQNRDDRVVRFDKDAYRKRNIVERLIGWLKESRRVLTRYEKTALNYMGFITLAIIQRLLRIAVS
jgi:transposase